MIHLDHISTYRIGDEVKVGGDKRLKITSTLGDALNLHETYRCVQLDQPGGSLVLKKFRDQGLGYELMQRDALDAFTHFRGVREQLVAAGLPDMHFCDSRHLVMDFIPGTNLENYEFSADIKDRVAYIRDLLLSVIQPMEALRQAGLVHRDIKAPNMIVRKNVTTSPGQKSSVITLIDLDMLTPSLDAPPSRKTTVFGTCSHMSTEVVNTGFYQFGSDVYALGVTGIEMLEHALDMSIMNTYTAYCENFQDYARNRHNKSWLLRDRWPQLVEDVSNSPYSWDPQSVRQVLGLIHECLHDEVSDRPKNGEVMRQLLADTGNIKEL